MGASIYALTEPGTGCVRYVGKANSVKRRLATHLREASRRNRPVNLWVRAIVAAGKKPGVEVLEADCQDWEAAEKHWISKLRQEGCALLNVADGGAMPWCSKRTCSQNGRASQSGWRKVINGVLRDFGKYARLMEDAGKPDKAAMHRNVQAKVRALSDDLKILFAAEYASRYPYLV